ncbi:hypothetical protein [Haladaptatus litoreus]|uniref:hypothetical protein n=1 Tax=Haladaptatus litoreus TaxID=553468 RepID=UPI0011158DE4|nr:hypothetical protein [Haladaptatus litoreus]
MDEKNKKNSWRAVTAARRWDEFTTSRKYGSGIFWTRADLKEATTAIDGEKPHGTTITRVWDALVELGGSDVVKKERRVSQKQEKVKIVAMDMATADGLNEMRYHEFDLLEDGTVTGVTQHSRDDLLNRAAFVCSRASLYRPAIGLGAVRVCRFVIS